MKKFLLLLPCIIYAQIDLRNYILKLDEQILKGNISNVSILKKSDKNITNITKSKIPLKKEQKTSKSNKPCKNSDEFIELNHTATSRNTFSRGAIKAAKWLVDQEVGLYSINDCLGL